jgi:hypothetical protein
VPVLGDTPELNTQQWSGSLRYLVSPRTALTLSPSFADWDFGASEDPNSEERNDSRSTSLTAGIERSLSVRDTIGLDLTEADNEFDQDAGIADSESTYQQAKLRWSRVWGALWSSSLSAGATRVQQSGQELDFQELPGESDPARGIDDTAFSGVGELLIARQTPRTMFQLVGSQTVSPSSGLGTDLTVLTLSSRFDWQLTRRWTFTAGAFWSDSQATGETLVFTVPTGTRGDIIVPSAGAPPSLLDFKTCGGGASAISTEDDQGLSVAVDAEGNPILDGQGIPVIGRRVGTACMGATDTAVDYQQQGLNLGLSWRMTRRFSTFLHYRFLDQSTGGDTDLDEFNQNVVSVGFTYRYDVDLY